MELGKTESKGIENLKKGSLFN